MRPSLISGWPQITIYSVIFELRFLDIRPTDFQNADSFLGKRVSSALCCLVCAVTDVCSMTSKNGVRMSSTAYEVNMHSSRKVMD